MKTRSFSVYPYIDSCFDTLHLVTKEGGFNTVYGVEGLRNTLDIFLSLWSSEFNNGMLFCCFTCMMCSHEILKHWNRFTWKVTITVFLGENFKSFAKTKPFPDQHWTHDLVHPNPDVALTSLDPFLTWTWDMYATWPRLFMLSPSQPRTGSDKIWSSRFLRFLSSWHWV